MGALFGGNKAESLQYQKTPGPLCSSIHCNLCANESVKHNSNIINTTTNSTHFSAIKNYNIDNLRDFKMRSQF